MTDNYEYNHSMEPQSDKDFSSYTDKQYNSYINDIDSGVYQNNGLSPVQFDLSSVYSSSKTYRYKWFICSSSYCNDHSLFY